MAESLYRPRRYQVGRPNDLKASDPWYDDAAEAVAAADAIHQEDTNDPVGVWDERSEWVYLFFDGQQFVRM